MEETKPGTGKLEYKHHNSIIGMPTDMWVKYMMDLGELHGLIDPKDFGKRYFDAISVASPTFEKIKGADSLTRFFAKQGIIQYMATSTPRTLIGAKIAPHNEMIDLLAGIVTADDVINGKPAPDIFLKAAELAGVPPHRCIVFEDSPLGVRGGLDAGMRVVAITFPGSDLSDFTGACQIVSDLSQFDSTALGMVKYICDE